MSRLPTFRTELLRTERNLRRRARWFRLFLVIVLVALTGPYLLTWYGLWLRPINRLEVVDALFIPNGDPDFVRTRYAADLYKHGYAHWFIVSGKGAGGDSAPLMAERAERLGVPQTAVLIEPEAQTTAENAFFSAPLLETHAIRSVIIVSSPYHLRRMLMCARKAWPGVRIRTVADEEPFDPTWWQSQAGWQIVGTETLKICRYTLRQEVRWF